MSHTALSDDAPHILVVDDDRRIRDLIKDFLATHGFRVSTASDAAQAREQLAGLSFDLLVLDVMMPGESGLELAKSIREEGDVPILILSALADPEHRIDGFESGGDDYLVKPFEPRELVLRINSILKRSTPPAQVPDEIKLADLVFHVERGELRKGSETIRLTTREQELLRLFAVRPGEPISRSELSQNGADESARAVDVQINRLRRKIEPDPSAPTYLQTVRGAGYILYTD
ncbi:MAG: response regulator transcription factor [Pseudomonadota bacterium]